jgi:phosphoesterase RecJ-like protein
MQSLTDLYKKTASFITENDNFLIIAHDHPDGDTIGSTLALKLFLKKMKKTAKVICKSPVPKVFSFIKGADEIEQDFLFGDFQSIILVDNGDLRRTGFDQRIREYRKQRKPILNIDHHPQNDIWKIAKINLVDQAVSSTAEIIFNLLSNLNKAKINADIATAILSGIYTDTGGFQHATTKAETLKLAAQLMSMGGKLKEISKNLSSQKSFSLLKLWGKVLKRLKLNNDYQVITSIITQEDMKEIGCSEEDLAGAVNLINSVSDAKAALLLYETKDGNIKGSLRTEEDDIDLSELAELFGGGGHKKAAGFTIKGKILNTNGKVTIE